MTTCTNTGKDKPAENASTLLSNSFLTPLQHTYRESKRNKQGGENKHLPSVVSVFNTIGEKERAPQRPDILNIYSQNQTCIWTHLEEDEPKTHTVCIQRRMVQTYRTRCSRLSALHVWFKLIQSHKATKTMCNRFV